jgi:hypothetical protein
MIWSPVTMRWPAQATVWLEGLSAAQNMASDEILSTGLRLAGLDGLAITNPGPVAAAAVAGVNAGRAALAEQLSLAPSCVVISPFQSGTGQAGSYQRFLSAPNLLQLMGDKFLDGHDSNSPTGEQHALALMFLATRFDQFAATLSSFNALLPTPEMERIERRAKHLSLLEAEKWEQPSANSGPSWQKMPLERCTVTKDAKSSLSGQLAMLEGYLADSSPMGDLKALSERKAKQAKEREQKLIALQEQLANGSPNSSILARRVGPGSPAELRRMLLEGQAPGHEWVLCAGLLLVGSGPSLSFVQELVGL